MPPSAGGWDSVMNYLAIGACICFLTMDILETCVVLWSLFNVMLINFGFQGPDLLLLRT